MTELCPAGVLRVIGDVLAFITFTTTLTVTVPALRAPERARVRKAMNAWWGPALVASAILVGGALAAIPIMCGVSLWTFREYVSLLPSEERHPGVEALAFAIIPTHYVLLATGSDRLFFGGILSLTFLALPLARAAMGPPRGMLTHVTRVQFGLMLTTLALSHVARLAALSPDRGSIGSRGLTALLFLSVMSGDAGQYLCGKLLGRHKLAPVLSPNKTWEGLVGGMLITALVSAAEAPRLTPFGRPWTALLGALMVVMGLLGDLLVSALKRDLGAKDTGDVLPGQGGVLDRCDSLLLTAPLFVYAIAPLAR